ncbi:MAG: hypothetical protein WDM88_00440 [Galbitalea sp.]
MQATTDLTAAMNAEILKLKAEGVTEGFIKVVAVASIVSRRMPRGRV